MNDSFSLIYDIYAGGQQINDKNHLSNFVNYLLSNTLRHKRNEKTNFNSYYINSLKEGLFYNNQEFNISNIKKEIIKNYVENCVFVNDLNYIYYAFKINNIIYTNFLNLNERGVIVEIGDEEFDFILKYKTEETFFNEVNNFIKDIDNLKIINFNYEDTLDKYSAIFDYKIHKYINTKYKTNDLVCAFSHQDQDSLYHIHRILKNN